MTPISKASRIEVSSSHNDWSDETSEHEQQETVGQLERVQQEINRLDRLGITEIYKINMKYNKLCQPFFQKRSELITKIPNFWATTLMGHPRIRLLLEEVDKDVLHYLNRVNVTDSEDSYRIDFHFEVNPYFENRVLSKEFLQKEGKKAWTESTEIKWKAGEGLNKCICQTASSELLRKRPRRGQGSIFFWFTERCSAVDEFLEILKDDIWLNPLLYYMAPDESNVEGDQMSEATELYCPETCRSDSAVEDENDRERNEEDDGCGWSELQWEC
ncbi:protein SET-like [Ambystoma mexicanum]|uniref:protein SET-like n=1 Tax=Ambystoma mexicanum TaxID=8296 RepID=UPI0037E707D3